MRPLLDLAAALCIAAAAASLDAAAQQPTPPTAPAPSAAPATPAVVKAKKKRRIAHARHRRTRHASLHYHLYNPCAIVDGWRAFPTHARNGYFDTRPVCRRY